jgi:Zn-dependent protease
MKGHTIPLGRIMGIPIGLDTTWFLIFALLTWSLAASYFPAQFNNWPTAEYWIVGAITAIMLFVSVLLHELGHSVIARRYKIPVRSITLFIFGGIAQIGGEPPSASAEFWIAIAGPIVSFLLGLLFSLARPAAVGLAPVLALVEYLAYINLTLALFNLIPGFPLDGGRVLRAIVWGITKSLRKATMIAGNVGRAFAYGFILVGVWQILVGNLVGGIWIAFIGWFLESAASAQLHHMALERVLSGHHVSEAMSGHYATLSYDLDLERAMDEHVLGSGRRTFIVERDRRPIGLLTLDKIREVGRQQWQNTTAEQAMIPLSSVRTVRPDADLAEVLDEMDTEGVNQLPVVVDNQVMGTLSRGDLISYLRNLHHAAA